MKKYFMNISAALLLIVCQSVFSGSGLLFDIAATGTQANVNITLCLNGKGPLSCQNYDVSALSLNICAVPRHFYPAAGIKINTRGYKVGDLGVDCEPFSNGYCLFPVSNTTCNLINLVVDGPLTLTPSSLTSATQNTLYSQTVTASGGVPPYTYRLTSGSLPAGLSLDQSTGEISGTPLTDSTYTFTITAIDSNSPVGTGSQAYTIVSNINTFQLWNGSDGITPFGIGSPSRATYGQTITAPSPASNVSLSSFTFYLSQTSGVTTQFQAFVYKWDPTNKHIIGSALFTSPIMTASSSGSFTPVTINTSDTPLTPGLPYVIFFTTSSISPPQSGSSVFSWGRVANDSYTGGQLVIQNNGADFGALSTVAWTLISFDAAFIATFTVT